MRDELGNFDDLVPVLVREIDTRAETFAECHLCESIGARNVVVSRPDCKVFVGCVKRTRGLPSKGDGAFHAPYKRRPIRAEVVEFNQGGTPPEISGRWTERERKEPPGSAESGVRGREVL